MPASLEYHVSVRQSIPASIGFLSLLALPAVFLANVYAQSPTAVTVPPLVGRSVNPPTSATSIGSSRVYAPNYAAQTTRHSDGPHHHHHYVDYAPPLLYAVPVPYAVDIGATDDDAGNADDQGDNDRGGPTIFDRRGSGASSYIPPVREVPTPHSAEAADASAAHPDPPQEPTLLIFKDGRNLEVGNYAIIGQTLFDLTPGHTRKVALADLDLEATRQRNDDRGITFQLPTPQAN